MLYVGEFSMEIGPVEGLVPESASAMNSSEVPLWELIDSVDFSIVGGGLIKISQVSEEALIATI